VHHEGQSVVEVGVVGSVVEAVGSVVEVVGSVVEAVGSVVEVVGSGRSPRSLSPWTW
jgi:hypothetical protein